MAEASIEDGPRGSFAEFRQGWPAVAGCLFGIATGAAALPFYTLGVFLGPIVHDTGWSRTAVSASTLCNTAVFFVAIPLMGRAADRFGVRPVVLGSLAAFALAYLGYLAVGASILSFYLASMVSSAAGAGTAIPFWTRGVSTWFDRRRGLAIGVGLLGSGLASVLGPPYAAEAVSLYGWRGGFAALALLPALIGLPAVALWYREAPRAVARPDRDAPDPDAPGLTLAETIRRTRFWRLGLAVFLANATTAGFVVHFVSMAAADGLTRPAAVAIASEAGLAVLAGRLLIGLLLDRWPVTRVGAGCFALCAAGLLALAAGRPTPLALNAVVIVLGLGTGAEVDFFTYAASRYFGLRNYGQIGGWLFCFFALGGGLGPMTAGLAIDRWGGYRAALLGGGVLLLGSAGLFVTLGRYPEAYAPKAGALTRSRSPG